MKPERARQIRAGVKMGQTIARGPFSYRLQLSLLSLYEGLYQPLVVQAMKHAFVSATTTTPPRKARR